MVETKKAPPISLKIKPKGSSSPPLSKPKETKPLSPSTKQPPKKIQMPSQDKPQGNYRNNRGPHEH